MIDLRKPKTWPFRTPVKSGAVYRGLFPMTPQKCGLGHEWSTTVPRKVCETCIVDLAYSIERFAAAIGGRRWIGLGSYPNLPAKGSQDWPIDQLLPTRQMRKEEAASA